MKCSKYNIGEFLPAHITIEDVTHPLKDAEGNYVSADRLLELGILTRVDAIPETGKIITQSHGEIINGEWVEVIDQQLTQAEIDAGIEAARLAADPPAVTALKSILQDEITVLNVKYPALELTAADTILSAIPKLLSVEALKGEVVYLKMLYDTVQEAGK